MSFIHGKNELLELELEYDTVVLFNTRGEVCRELGIGEIRKDEDMYIVRYGDHGYLFVPVSCIHSQSYHIIKAVCSKIKGRKLLLLYACNAADLGDLKIYLKRILVKGVDYQSAGAYTGNGRGYLSNRIDQVHIQNYF